MSSESEAEGIQKAEEDSSDYSYDQEDEEEEGNFSSTNAD